MKNILIVAGTRPEAIKLSPIYIELRKEQKHFQPFLCVTAQHREMLDQVLSFFEITPDFDLDLMKENQTLNGIISRVILGVDKIISEIKPDIILVQGDTTTTLGASIAGFYSNIPIGHIEAGLRTYNLLAPFPEEGNRQLVSRISNFHFAPTYKNKEVLLKEGVSEENIFITGNPVIDALFWAKEKIYNEKNVTGNRNFETIDKYIDNNRRFILITGHRRENFGAGFQQICLALKILAENNPDLDFIYPVHLNPNVREPVFSVLNDLDNFYLIEPLEYPAFVKMMDKSLLILTDSGGIQEEAPSLGKPVLVMRDVTERIEALEAGTIKLVGTCTHNIIRETQKLINDKIKYDQMVSRENPYGNGDSARQIGKILREKL